MSLQGFEQNYRRQDNQIFCSAKAIGYQYLHCRSCRSVWSGFSLNLFMHTFPGPAIAKLWAAWPGGGAAEGPLHPGGPEGRGRRSSPAPWPPPAAPDTPPPARCSQTTPALGVRKTMYQKDFCRTVRMRIVHTFYPLIGLYVMTRILMSLAIL